MESASTVWLWISSAALGVVLAASAGLRAWLPLLVTAIGARMGLVTLGESFAFLASTPALILFSVATVVEIAGDKIPAVDHALDVVSTGLRPASGALLSAAVMWRSQDPLLAAVLGVVVGAPLALAPHAVKAATRSASSATTGGVGNPLLSLLEDAVALVLAVLAVLVPLLALLFLVLASWTLLRVYRRWRAAPA